MRILFTLATAVTSLVVLAGACKKQDDTMPPTAPTATAGAYPSYPPAQPTAYPQSYPQPAPTATYGQYPQPTNQPPPMATAPVPTAPGTAAPGQMAVPGPVAFTCTSDVPCGTHHCNTQYGKCAFPCQSAADCIAPNSCMMGLCVPAPPAAH